MFESKSPSSPSKSATTSNNNNNNNNNNNDSNDNIGLSSSSSNTSISDLHILNIRTSIISDFAFLNWVINALMFPELYNLGPMYPISAISRRNLQVVGTVLIKLMNGSRFTAFQQQHLKPVIK